MSNTDQQEQPLVSIVMGSASDWPTMSKAAKTLRDFGIPFESNVISAHRTTERCVEYAKGLKGRGVKILIAGAGCAAHLPGVCSALTTIPVLGVPIQSKALNGVDSLLSIVQMPGGIPTATFSIGEPGAINAALFAVSILANSDESIEAKLLEFREGLRTKAAAVTLPPLED